ncbi:hypothetical protein [Xylanimonas sp. McL0601]|uniref:hypothetical protein n=1 Tax=Xylanimonas sp. McL0601 TaxID=3414739 RepID=UPI003CEC90A2
MSISPEEARAALAAADAGHRAVVDEVGAPAWYWWGLGVAWVGFGVIADLDIFWLTIVTTLVFGAAHSQAFVWVAGGRHRTGLVSVRRSVAGGRTMLHVWLMLLAMVVVGVVFALLVAYDGAAHPAIIGSVLPAAIVVAAGPRLVRWSALREAGARA